MRLIKKTIQIFLFLPFISMTSCAGGTFFLTSSSLLIEGENKNTEIGMFSSEPIVNSERSDNVGWNNSFNSDGAFYKWNDVSGLTFTSDDVYVFDKTLARVPLTFETTIELPSDFTDRAGIILGNYEEGQASINLEIHTNGHPRLYYCNGSGDYYDFLFYDVNVNRGAKLNLSIVDDPTTGLLKCYVDGKLEQTLNNHVYKWIPTTKMRVGSDARNGNNQYFKGTIYNLALFASIKNEKSINNDLVGINIESDDLLAAFELNNSNKQLDIPGIKSTLNLIYDAAWMPFIESPGNFAYSFAIVGDTQTMNYKWPNEFHCIYDYIIEHKESEKIALCIGLGDITDGDTDAEWGLAKSQISRMNGIVPYVLNRGNHDSKNRFNSYFGLQTDYYYSTLTGLYESSNIENSFLSLNVGTQKYLLFALDYGVPDNVIEWAETIIKKHPNHRIIITTHSYLFRDGTTLDKDDVWPPTNENSQLNNGDHIWEKFIKKYDIDLIICGHDPSDDIVCSKAINDNGNVVTQMLVDPQGIDLSEPTGMVAMLYFSDDGESLDIRYYSTVKNMWFKRNNQFALKLKQM